MHQLLARHSSLTYQLSVDMWKLCLLFALPLVVGSWHTHLDMAALTSSLASHLQSRCLFVLTSPDCFVSPNQQMFLLYKSLAFHSRSAMALVSYTNWISLGEQLTANCYSSLAVFLDGGNQSKAAFAQTSHKFNMASTACLLIPENSLEDFFEHSSTPFNSEVIAVTSTVASTEAVLHEVYRVTVDSPLRVSRWGQWREGELQLRQGNLYARRWDLEGTVLKTGSLENWPLSTFDGSKYRGEGWDGYFPRVWRELEGLLNCTSLNLRAADNSTGVKFSNGTWNGLVGMTLRGDIDVIVSELTMNQDRSRVFDFSHPLLISRYNVYYKHPGYQLEWMALFKPLYTDTWFAIIFWLILGSFSLHLCHIACQYFGLQRREDESYSIPTALFFMVQSLSQQGSTIVPESAVCRVIFLCAYLVSAVVIPAYSASLISFLTNQSPSRPFDSLEAMIEDGSYKLLMGRNTAEYSFFANATHQLYLDVYEHLMKPIPEAMVQNNSLDTLSEVCLNSRYAIFGVEDIISLKLESRGVNCRVISFSQSLSTVYMAMALRRASPFSGVINHHLQKMFDAGVIKRIQKTIWLEARLDFTAKWSQVQLVQVSQIFAYLLLAMILSLVVLLVEHLVNNYSFHTFYL